MIDDALTHERIITVEDGTRHGGAGTLMVSAVRSRAQELERPFPTTRILGVPRAYLEHHRPDDLLAELGLDPEGLAGGLRAPAGRRAGVPARRARGPAPQLLLGSASRSLQCAVTFEIEKTDDEWRAELSPDRYAVLRRAATEAPFTGSLLHVDGEGVFTLRRAAASVLFT